MHSKHSNISSLSSSGSESEEQPPKGSANQHIVVPSKMTSNNSGNKDYKDNVRNQNKRRITKENSIPKIQNRNSFYVNDFKSDNLIKEANNKNVEKNTANTNIIIAGDGDKYTHFNNSFKLNDSMSPRSSKSIQVGTPKNQWKDHKELRVSLR